MELVAQNQLKESNTFLHQEYFFFAFAFIESKSIRKKEPSLNILFSDDNHFFPLSCSQWNKCLTIFCLLVNRNKRLTRRKKEK